MTTELEVGLYIFMLAGFLGYHIITRVPPLLHTPLMSATNAIAAISLVGSVVVAGSDYRDVPNGWVCTLLGFLAVICSSTNAVGGFLITDRMLRMFKTAEERARGKRRAVELQTLAGVLAGSGVVVALLYWTKPSGMPLGEFLREHIAAETLRYAYIVSATMFVLGLKGLSSPKRARAGMGLAALGMFIAVVGTLFHPQIVTYQWIVLGFLIGAVVGGALGLSIPMTAVPQRTALSHSLGALAACLVESPSTSASRGAQPCHVDGPRLRGGGRRAAFTGSPDGRGQASGTVARAARHVSRPKRFQFEPAGGDPRLRGVPGNHPGSHAPFFYVMVGLSLLLAAARHPDWRSRHAGGDRVA
jgi:NAD(P) transhydrogenase subunit alpha